MMTSFSPQAPNWKRWWIFWREPL